jgi:hypothetical protein
MAEDVGRSASGLFLIAGTGIEEESDGRQVASVVERRNLQS